MDLLFWNNYKGVLIQDTQKQFYKKFLWRLVVRAEGGRLLESKSASLQDALTARRETAKAYNYGGSWGWRGNNHLNNVNIDLLETIREIKSKNTDIRVRVEEPLIQFYAETEEELKLVAVRLSTFDCVTAISGPNDVTADILKSGGIVIKKKSDFPYKIIFRDGRYTADVKLQLLDFLLAQGEDVKISRGVQDMLKKSYPSIWGVFCYTKDPQIATFISLIDPTLVSNIHELVYLGE